MHRGHIWSNLLHMSFDKFLTKVFGSSNQRFLKSIMPLVEKINSLEPSVQALSDDELRGRTTIFKERVQQAVGDTTDKEERKRRERAILDELLPEAFERLIPLTIPVGVWNDQELERRLRHETKSIFPPNPSC